MKPTTSPQAASAAASSSQKPSTLDKVAMAIKDTGLLEYDDTDTLMQLARAALQSLRQVDDETLEAMSPAMVEWLDGSVTDQPAAARRAFTAAIDHILTEGGEG